MKIAMNWRRRSQPGSGPTMSKRFPGRRAKFGIGLVIVLTLLSGAGWWGGWLTASANTLPAQLAPVTRGDLSITVESSGSVRPERSLDLAFSESGKVEEVLVKAGQWVKRGQPLARLNDAELKLKVTQAEADLKTAEAGLEAAREGSTTPEEQAQAEAGIAAAEANLHRTRTGNATAAEIANAEAVVRAAEAHLRKITSAAPADLAEAEAAVRGAEATLQKTRTGNYTAGDIAEAEAAVRTAEARVREIEAGATPAEASAAELKLKEAQKAYDHAGATASTTKTNAQREMNTQAEKLRSAQDTYSSAYWAHQQAESGIDPQSGQRFEEMGKDPAIEQRKYAEAWREAERQLRQAETALDGARVAYEQAQQAETRDVAAAQAVLDDARVQYETALRGAKESARVEAQGNLDQARARLDKMRKGGTATDIAAAQASVDQARARLQKLKNGGTAAEIAAAQASLDQARAGLAKLKQGGTAADIAEAQASLDKAQAGLEQLTAPQAPSEIATAEAKVAQAQAQVEAAKLTLQQATLTAPFDGTIAMVSVEPGSVVSPSGTALTLVDLSAFSVDIDLSETDVARVQVGQAVTLTFDALENVTAMGKVASIAPTANSGTDLVTYTVRVQFTSPAEAIKAGMTANAAIEVERHEDVIHVPNRAIQSEGPIKTIQVVPGEGKDPVTIRVKTGATDGATTEIMQCSDTGKQCLREGDKLVLPTPRNVSGPKGQGGDVMFAGPEGEAPPAGAPRAIPIAP